MTSICKCTLLHIVIPQCETVCDICWITEVVCACARACVCHLSWSTIPWGTEFANPTLKSYRFPHGTEVTSKTRIYCFHPFLFSLISIPPPPHLLTPLLFIHSTNSRHYARGKGNEGVMNSGWYLSNTTKNLFQDTVSEEKDKGKKRSNCVDGHNG